MWAANRHPGSACDIPASLYSFSFAPKADWTRRHPPQREIRAYPRDVAERFDVLHRLRSRPAVPALPGLGDFAGTTLHSATWRHDDDLTGRRAAAG